MPGKALSWASWGRFDELCARFAMAEIINLNKHRKAKARDAHESQSAANRVKYGRTKAEKENDRRAEERSAQLHQDRELDKKD
jgi:hypothetical protein